MNANVCYLHKQDVNKWQWFLADSYGKAILKHQEEFDTKEEAEASYEQNKEEYNKRVTV